MTPQEELELVLDADHAVAVIEHRKAKRAKLTSYAAKLLAGQFARCPDPNAAADAMILNGWQGFKPEWLERQNVGRGLPLKGIEARQADLRQRIANDYGMERPGSPDPRDAGRLRLERR